VLIITVVGLGFLQLGELEERLFLQEARSSQALSAAQGAVRRVAWSLRQLPILKAGHPGTYLNPFHATWYGDPSVPLKDTDLMDLVNPKPGEGFYPAPQEGYYWIAEVSGAETKVRVRVLGSVDADGDGIGGLGDQDGDGYSDLADADAQDTNRFIEVFLGLPGTLGQDVAAAAQDVVDSAGGSMALTWSPSGMKTTKNHDLAGFWYDRISGSFQYGTVFSKLLLRGSGGGGDLSEGVRLPKGLFLSSGSPDPAYFGGLPMRVYEGDQIFAPTNDPTSGSSAGSIVWVNGNATIRDVSFGSVSSPGDWTRRDVVLVATGQIIAQNVICGWPGRLVLVAQNIDLSAQWGRGINGVALASGDIRLLSSVPQSFQWVYVFSSSWPAFLANYFYGSMVAGGRIRVMNGGWAVIFDRAVLNGTMGQNPPTRILDRFEGEGLGACWATAGQVTQIFQGRYLQDETDNRAGNWEDGGNDGVPELLRVTVSPLVNDSGLGEEVSTVFDGSRAGCPTSPERPGDWSAHSGVQFHMAMDNYQSPPTDLGGGITLTTEREAQVTLVLADGSSPPHQLEYHLNLDDDPLWSQEKYLRGQWGDDRYDISGGDVQDPDATTDDYGDGHLPRWKFIDMSFSAPHGDTQNFDFRNVRELKLRLDSLRLSWIRQSALGSSVREINGGDGRLKFDPDGAGGVEPIEVQKDSEGYLQYEVSPGVLKYVPCDAADECWGVLKVRETDLVTTLRLDRLNLPGGALMDNGLPWCFSMESSRWRELSEAEAMR
jgi:hypothetical protein